MAAGRGTTIGNAILWLRGDNTDLKKKVGASLKLTQQAFQKMGEGMKRAGRAFTVIGAATSAAIFGLAKLGATAEENENLFEVSMGGMADAARKWSIEVAKALKTNQFAVRKQVATLNVMLKSMGLSEEAAYDMAKSMTVLTLDMASFYNLPTEEAFEKLQAGITGEAEPLKWLGILINETSVKIYAASKGIGTMTGGLDANAKQLIILSNELSINTAKVLRSKKTTEEKRLALDKLNMAFETKSAKLGEINVKLGETDKVMARYGLIMERTTAAQGDMARTLGSTMNQMRALKEKTVEMATFLGMVLSPVIGIISEALFPVVEKMGAWIEANKEMLKSKVVEAMKAFMGALRELWDFLSPVVSKLWEWMKANPELAAKIAVVATGVAALGVVFGPVLIVLGSVVSAIGSGIGLAAGSGTLIFAFAAAALAVGALAQALLNKNGQNFLNDWVDSLPGVKGKIDKFFDWLVSDVNEVIDAFRSLKEWMGFESSMGHGASGNNIDPQVVPKSIRDRQWENLEGAGASGISISIGTMAVREEADIERVALRLRDLTRQEMFVRGRR